MENKLETLNLGDTSNTPEVEESVTEAPVASEKVSTAPKPKQFASPVKGKWKVSCSFECHKDRTPPSQLPGTDIVVKLGTAVYASHDGVVTVADSVDDSASGKWIQVTQGKVVSYYLHLSKVSSKKGKRVKQGDLIGYSGSTGASSGPHLHFSLKVNGKLVDPDKHM